MPARILVVGDNDLPQFMLRSALEARGYRVETVSDGLQAVRMIRREAYDLVLADYLIPGIDGLAVARLILNLMSESVRPRMVALTSEPGSLAARELETGSAFDEVVVKSSDLSALLAIVDRQLRSSPISATRRAADVTLPVASGGPFYAARPDMAGKPRSAGTLDGLSHADHHILLVDDVADVLVTVGAFLVKDGFAVQKAANGDQALSLIASDPKIDVLVTDFAMPGLSGVELVAQALQIRPNLKALVITGYPNADGLAELPPHTTILAKPFRRTSLIARIKSLLNEMQPVTNETMGLPERIDIIVYEPIDRKAE